MARTILAAMGETLGRSFVVENRAGGAGSLGAELAARAAPDGYTLLAGSGGSLTANPVLQANLSYDPLRDFAPVGLLARVPNALVLAPRMAQRSWPELLATAKAAPGSLNIAMDPAVAERFKLTQPSGALVIGVVHDLPASKAGVPPGSVIVALDNQPVRSPNELTQLVTRGPIGRPVTLQYILPGGEQRRAEVSLQSLEVPLERALVGPEE
jgi:membrane-associated protease RseP (regulator of RpoE activity)